MRRLQTALACAAMAFSLAACGGSDETSGANGGSGNGGSGGGQPEETMTEAAIEDQYARGQYNLTEDGAADDQYADATEEDLPFPLPPEADIIAAGQSEEMAYAVAMNVPSGQEAYEFYLQSLPDAGFEIVRDSAAPNEENGNAEGGNAEGGNGEDDASDEEPFSAVLEVEGNELRGIMRFDEERAIIGISAAAFQNAVEAEKQNSEETAPER